MSHASSSSWLFTSILAAAVAALAVACTVESGPATDDDAPVKSSSSSSGGSSSSSGGSSSGGTSSSSGGSSSGDSDAGGACSDGFILPPEQTGADPDNGTTACQECTAANCLDQSAACFCNEIGTAAACQDYFTGYATCFELEDEAAQDECVSDLDEADPDGSALYDAFISCQITSCETECFPE